MIASGVQPRADKKKGHGAPCPYISGMKGRHIVNQLDGKVVLVTGASRGIGRAIALDLAAHGADVVVNYANRLDAAEGVSDAIRDMGRRALPLQADVAQAAAVERMIAEAMETFGQIDVLVNNATLHRGRRVEKLPESDWDAVIDSWVLITLSAKCSI